MVMGCFGGDVGMLVGPVWKAGLFCDFARLVARERGRYRSACLLAGRCAQYSVMHLNLRENKEIKQVRRMQQRGPAHGLP